MEPNESSPSEREVILRFKREMSAALRRIKKHIDHHNPDENKENQEEEKEDVNDEQNATH